MIDSEFINVHEDNQFYGMMIEAMEIEVLCSELEWERPSQARDTTIEELWFPGES